MYVVECMNMFNKYSQITGLLILNPVISFPFPVTFHGAGYTDIEVAPAVPSEVFLNLRGSEKRFPEQPESSSHTEPEAHTVLTDCLVSKY